MPPKGATPRALTQAEQAAKAHEEAKQGSKRLTEILSKIQKQTPAFKSKKTAEELEDHMRALESLETEAIAAGDYEGLEEIFENAKKIVRGRLETVHEVGDHSQRKKV